MTELKPCKCGGNAMFVSEPDRINGGFVYYYQCDKCFTEAPASKEVSTAKKNWNNEANNG